MSAFRPSRRALLAGLSALPLAAPTVLRAEEGFDRPHRRNISSFKIQNWRDHFDTLGSGAIVCDLTSRALHFWNAEETVYKLYPTSVPMSEELTKRGFTKVVRKKVGPTWTPTASMRERNPSLPEFMPAGPGNPLGTHAMYLGWPAYLIHGTHDTRKIGRRSSSGCVGLFNEQVAELFELVPVGCQVRLI